MRLLKWSRIEELEWANNSVGNRVRPYCLRLQDLSKAESAELLAILLALDVADDLPVTMLIGLCADANTAWVDLRVGELKTLAALHANSPDDILDGCAWNAQFGELPENRARVYRCIANIVQIKDMTDSEDTSAFEANLSLMYGTETLQQAHKLLNREDQYFGLGLLGANMEGSVMHQQLLAAYAKVWR